MNYQEKIALVLNILKEDYGIIFGEQLTLGNVCKSVYRGRFSGEDVVVKIGISGLEQEEIRKNVLGYQEMISIGAKSLIPDPLKCFSVRDSSVIIMQDCGLDFWHAVQQSSRPVTLYERLAEKLKLAYRETKNNAQKAIESLEEIRTRLLEQYDKYLFPAFSESFDTQHIVDFEKQNLGKFLPQYSCFSTFDFTPEDVFLSSFGLKYADPQPGLLGIPAIDLACFAGVARDAYDLPGSKEGYEILKALAIYELPQIIGLDSVMCNKVFLLGRSLQCALSSRFRIGEDFQKAKILYRKSEFFLERFLGN